MSPDFITNHPQSVHISDTECFTVRDSLQELGDKGDFKRVDSKYRDWVKEGSEEFPSEVCDTASD